MNTSLTNSRKSTHEDEISLLDITHFVKGAYKTILVFGITGLAIAVAYLEIVPKQYEAVAQIAMAQIGIANNNNNSLIPLGSNIEEPSLLISRLSQPTSFDSETVRACGIVEDANLGGAASLAQSIKLVMPKGVANMVVLRVIGKSPEAALGCAQALFELVKSTQMQILAPYIVEAKLKLADDIDRLGKAKDLVSKADKSGSTMGAAYLSTRDEIRYLLDEITTLKNIVATNQSRATRLINPIYVSNTPIAPKRQAVLSAGLCGGLFLGLLLALGRQIWSKLNADAKEQQQGGR